MGESDLKNPEPSDSGEDKQESAGKPSPARRGGLVNFFAAMRHINEASVAQAVKQRYSDYLSYILVVVCVLSLVAAVAIKVEPEFKLLPLFFTVGAVLFYIINRLGIILALSARQALIVWQILTASFWLGVTSAMLVTLVCFYYFNMSFAHYR